MNMKCIWKSIAIVTLVLAGFGPLIDSQAHQPEVSARLSYSASKTIEFKSAMFGSSIKAEFRRRTLTLGVWGGQHISFDVSARRTMVEYDCAHATIDQKIFLDSRGRFSVSGTQVQERGGPVRQGDEQGFPVRFTGQVKGKTLTLTVTNSQTKEEIGTFTLVHGSQPRLFKCK